jgi:hypothetical protein
MQGKPDPQEMACPLMGLASDRLTRFQFPARGHRCWAMPRAVEVEVSFQAAICIGSDYHDCVRHRLWVQKRALAAEPGPQVEPKPASKSYRKGWPILRKGLAANTERV